MRRHPSVVFVALAVLAQLAAADPIEAQQPDSTAPKAFPSDSVRRTRKLGRIVTVDHTAMGDVRTSELVFAPTAFYAPETGFGGGAGLVYSRLVGDHDPDQRPSTFQGALQVTQEQQYTVSSVGDIWTKSDRYRFQYEAIWSHFPQLFFGIGPSSPADGQRWEPTLQRLAGAAWENVRPHLYIGVQAMAEHEAVALSDPGSLTTGVVPGQLGWTVAQLGVMASHDTRDPYYFPYRGVVLNATLIHADPAYGSEFTYTRATLEMRAFHSLGYGVLAGHAWVDAVAGDVPFDRLPQIGGAYIVRGMWDGRFRDKSAMALQGEYRSPAWHRLGFVTFAAVGAVAPSLTTIDASLFHFAGGAGLRFALTGDDRLNLRIDHGWGRGTSGTYFTIGEAF